MIVSLQYEPLWPAQFSESIPAELEERQAFTELVGSGLLPDALPGFRDVCG